jgi:hypothetical protein
MADALAGGSHDGGVPHVVMLSAIAAVLPDGNGSAKDLHQHRSTMSSRGSYEAVRPA